jgi:CRP-like cAMP-binding protein
VGFAALAAAAMEFSSMYEHDTTELMNGTLDTDLAHTPREGGADDEEAAVAALMEQAKEEEEAFKGNRYTLGGFGWSREDRRPHRAPPGAQWDDTLWEDGESDGRGKNDGYTDPLDNYLVEKLNPFSKSHELPGERPFDASGRIPPLQHTWDPFTQRTEEDLPPLGRDTSVHGQRFRKYKDLFFEKSRERANETGGVQLHEPIVLASTKKAGEFDDEEAILEEGSKVAQNILQASVLSAIRKPASERSARETKYIVDWLLSVEFLHNLNTDMRTELSVCCTLITLKSNEFVFRKGDPGDGFYILFKGAAKLLDPNGPQDPNHKDFKPFKVMKNSTESFGEVALFSNKPRSLGIMAEGESTFVFINTVDFLQVMQGRKHEETQAKTALLNSMPLFEQCSDEQLHNTAMFMFQRKYEKGQIIAKEGEDCPNIYLMESGEVELRQVCTANYAICLHRSRSSGCFLGSNHM